MDLSLKNIEEQLAATKAARDALPDMLAPVKQIDALIAMSPPPYVKEKLDEARAALLRARHVGGSFIAGRINVLDTARKAITDNAMDGE